MTAFFAGVNLILLIAIAWQMQRGYSGSLSVFFWPALLFKLMTGVAIGLLYSYYYSSGDTFLYFNDGVTLASLARRDLSSYLQFLWHGDDSFPIWVSLADGQQSRVLFMVKFTSLINLVTHDNYWISSLYFSLVSFAFAWKLVRLISQTFPQVSSPAVIGFLFLPSAVFWSSGLIKESLAMASVFFLSAVVIKVWSKMSLQYWEWIALPFFLWLLWSLKYFYLAVFFPVAASSIVAYVIFNGRLAFLSRSSKMILLTTAVVVVFVSVILMHPNFEPSVFFEVIVTNYNLLHAMSAPDDVIYYHNLQPTIESIALNMPWALISGLFRPFFWEASTVLQLLASLENLVLVVLTIFAVFNLSRYVKSAHRLKLVTLLAYVVLLCIFLALSTPNFGTLSRYRVGFLPYFFLLITIYNPVGMRAARLMKRYSNHLIR